MAWMYCMFLLARRWETVMMSTIADEGTNSDGREVTTTAQESEKTDAGMIGTTGKEKKNGEETAFICSCATLSVCPFLTSYFCIKMAREWDRGRERRSRGEYRDYDRGRRERFTPPRHDMSPQQKRMRRDWWDWQQCLCTIFSAVTCCLKSFICHPIGMIMVEILTEEDTTWVMVAEEGPVMAPRSTGATLTCISCSLIMASPFKQGERWNY